MRSRLSIALPLAIVMATLSACDTAEERAERYYQSGLEYLEAGDIDRALVEFRNVFSLNGEHHDARLAYADAERARGNVREAYSQYLRLVEQYPTDPAGLKALAELATEAGQWADAERFLALALKGQPDDLALQATRVFKTYGKAVEDNDATQIIAAVTEAQKLREKAPDDLKLRKVIIDDLVRGQKLGEALKELDAAIAAAPTEKLLYAQRISVHAALQDDAAVEAGLVEMVKLFPDAPEMADALQRWYLSRKDYDKAEAFLRSRIDPTSDDSQPTIELIRFLGQFRGPEAAMTELDKVIATGKSPSIFRSARAGFLFDRGDHAGAIAEMEAILKDTSEGEESRLIKVALARMQLAEGDNVSARALVEEVLGEDSGNVEAIKLKASWLIMDDSAADAIALLRNAIDQNPQNAALLTLLAQAYERNGDRDLMRDMLSLAVTASNRAPGESLRYAQLLAAENKLLPAEGVLIEALRIAPGEPMLLVPLGQIYVALKDWPRAESVAKELGALEEPRLSSDIAGLRAAILNGQQKTGDALAYLEGLAAREGAQLDVKIAVVRSLLASGKSAEALDFVKKALDEDPGNLDLMFVHANVLLMTGDLTQGEAEIRAVLDKDAARTDAWMTLFQLVYSDPARRAQAVEVVDQALAAQPQSAELLWAKAGLLEGKGDIDGAIAIYEDLYRRDSANQIVANNLASLLSSYRKDAESLKRAEIIARRLRASGVPAFQDTYGWIAYLNGNHEAALAELEPAAAGLPNDPTVQYHLAMVYLAAGRKPEAAKKLADSLALLPADDQREVAISARTELEKLKAAGIAPESP